MKAFVLALAAASFCAGHARADELGLPALGTSLGLPQLSHPSLLSEFGLPSSGMSAPKPPSPATPAGGAAHSTGSARYPLQPKPDGAFAPAPTGPGAWVPDTELGDNALRSEGFKGVLPPPASDDVRAAPPRASSDVTAASPPQANIDVTAPPPPPTPMELERDALGGLEPANGVPNAEAEPYPRLPAELGGGAVLQKRPHKASVDKADQDKTDQEDLLGELGRPHKRASSVGFDQTWSPEPDDSSHIEWKYMKDALKKGLVAVLGFMGDY